MEKNRKRALRRHHVARLKRTRLDYYGGYIRRLGKKEQERHLGILSRTAQLCSCYMCGNPRRYWKEMTLPERRLADRTQTELDDLMNDETSWQQL